MTPTGKILLISGIGAGLALLAAGSGKATDLKALADQLTVEQNGRIHSFNKNGLVLAVDAKLKNPTKGSLSFTHPFVSLQHNGDTLVTSQVTADTYTLNPMSELSLKTIYFVLPLTNLLKTIPALGMEYLSKGTLKLDVVTSTNLFGRFPYSKLDTMSFGKEKKTTSTHLKGLGEIGDVLKMNSDGDASAERDYQVIYLN